MALGVGPVVIYCEEYDNRLETSQGGGYSSNNIKLCRRLDGKPVLPPISVTPDL